jgi:hydroxypyruvate isomerase
MGWSRRKERGVAVKLNINEAMRVACAIGESEVHVLATIDERVELSVDDDGYIIRSNHTDDGKAYDGGLTFETMGETVAALKELDVTDLTEWDIFDV